MLSELLLVAEDFGTNIISLDKEHLVIGQDGYSVTYVRK